MKVLVTGATGYIGGRLVPRLLANGHQLRVLVRDPSRIVGRPWTERVEVVAGDLRRPESLGPAFEEVEAAYYLVHSMTDSQDFGAVEATCARNFAQAARGLDLCIYLGGLIPTVDSVSEHLCSRARVGEILRASLPTTEFRAGPIIGSGSASFEMVRYLTERLPIMITPRWVDNPVQPINIRAVLDYLIRALEKDPLGVVDIGAERLTFRAMMEQYAEIRGLRRKIFPVPVLAPRLAALLVGLVTPIPNSLAVPLVQGVVHPVVADTTRAGEVFPDIEPFDYRTACRLAVERTARKMVET
ncbi:MAG: NAD(P)H-binding protein, partial [Candidatus Eremiobacteraeota bacterium]|nr:NAD(P)H-binding protein [Candidatus Eremiobacteraeota bacterium]